MTNPLVDTSVLIRLLTGDDPTKQAAASTLFEKVEAGEITLLAPDTVIADAVYVLSSKQLYNLPRREIQELLGTLLSLPRFQIENRRGLLLALSIYADANLDFGDALIAAEMSLTATSDLYSYDKDFDRLQGITRLEP